MRMRAGSSVAAPPGFRARILLSFDRLLQLRSAHEFRPHNSCTPHSQHGTRWDPAIGAGSVGYPVGKLAIWERAGQSLFARYLSGPALYGMAHRFPHYREGGRALDIGCGNGSYLSYLKHYGWSVAGVEMSHAAAGMAKEAFGIDVFVGNVRDAGFSAHSFDFVHMSHVIEHVPDPVDVLRTVSGLLKPTGSLYIETPNEASCGAKACGQLWFPWDPPRHLVVFSPQTLRAAVREAGLKVSRLWTGHQPLLFEWEDTFAQEDEGCSVEHRPTLRSARRRRAISLSVARRIQRLVHPLSGDILFCTARASRLV